MVHTIVSHYGVHWSPSGIAWLHQGRGAAPAVAIHEKTPFVVQLPGHRKHCNHQITLSNPVPNDFHWEFVERFIADPLFQAMLPVPKTDDGLYFIEDNDGGLNRLLVTLARMSSPIYPVVKQAWEIEPTKLLNTMANSNIQPLVVVGFEPKHTSLIAKLALGVTQSPSKLVMTGSRGVVLPTSVKRIATAMMNYDLDEIIQLPLEALGAVILKKYMRKEWPIIPGGTYDGTIHSTGLPSL